MKEMQKITSFTIDHLKLLPGLYVSRRDRIGSEFVTTFDLRITRPNEEPVMDTPAVHTLEHLGATFLRNHESWKDRVIYFGPMGCRTGFYLLLAGDLTSEDIFDLVREMFLFMAGFGWTMRNKTAATPNLPFSENNGKSSARCDLPLFLSCL